MYRKITQSKTYRNENGEAIEIIEKAENKTGYHTNISLDLQLLNRRSKLIPGESTIHEYTQLFLKYGYSLSSMVTIYVHRARWLFHEKIYLTLCFKQESNGLTTVS